MNRHGRWISLLAAIAVVACSKPDADAVQESLASHGASASLVLASSQRRDVTRGYARVAFAALRTAVSQDSADAMRNNVAPSRRAPLRARADSLARAIDAMRASVEASRR